MAVPARYHFGIGKGEVEVVGNILIPLDGSQVAEQVLPHVKAIVECKSARVHLLSVAPVIDNAAAAVMLYPLYVHREQLADEDAERQRIQTELGNYLRNIARDFEQMGAKVHCVVRFGSPANEILSYAGENKIELIAMCTHGWSGLARWAYGSVADRVLRSSGCPVLLVRAK
jgi:nucleotide-binding universal stress UspA family protein